MSDDLVKRLRQGGTYQHDTVPMQKAADRIEKLEMQLFSEKALRQSLEETVSIHSQRQNKRIKRLEALLRSFPGFTDDARIGDPWIEAVRKALEGEE